MVILHRADQAPCLRSQLTANVRPQIEMPYHCLTIGAAVAVCNLALGQVAANAGEVPMAAKTTITKVGQAAAGRDFKSLESMMIKEFTWSFGGDGSAEQAIEAWQRRPETLAELSKATQSKCGYVAADVVQCPQKTKLGLRAGFKETTAGWKMVYFVGGD